MVTFIIGLFAGGIVGVLAMALAVVAKQSDLAEERQALRKATIDAHLRLVESTSVSGEDE